MNSIFKQLLKQLKILLLVVFSPIWLFGQLNNSKEIVHKGKIGSTNPLEWVLVWEDDFNGNKIDTTIWSKIIRGTAEWNKYMSDYNSLYDVKDGNLILRGIVNCTNDTVPFITGEVWTKNKKSFHRESRNQG